MRITGKQTRRLSDNKGKHSELEIVCRRIEAQAIAGDTQATFSALGDGTNQWLRSYGFEVESDDEFTTVSWANALL